MNDLRKTEHGWLDSNQTMIRQIIFINHKPSIIYRLHNTDWGCIIDELYFRQHKISIPLPLWLEFG